MDSRGDFLDGARRLVSAARPAFENVLVFHHIDSTHACALRLIEQAENEEIVLPTTLVIAGSQNRGHGRADRMWISPPGGLYLSVIVTGLDSKIIPRLPMVAASAAHEAVNRLGVEDLVIKWPNDLLIDDRKIAGLLVHARHGTTTWVTIGIGINLDHAPALEDSDPTTAVSVADLIPEGDYWSWAEAIIAALAVDLPAGLADPEAHITRWRECLHHRPGDAMVVRLGDGSRIHGRFSGLNDDGHLRLDVDGEEQIISAGDVIA